jgi:hypothetical protein
MRVAAAAAALAACAAEVSAQHEGHGAAKPTPVRGVTGDCAASVREGLRALDAASRRIEEARQTNNPAKMRVVVEELQRDLAELRARLSASIPESPTPSAPGGRMP